MINFTIKLKYSSPPHANWRVAWLPDAEPGAIYHSNDYLKSDESAQFNKVPEGKGTLHPFWIHSIPYGLVTVLMPPQQVTVKNGDVVVLNVDTQSVDIPSPATSKAWIVGVVLLAIAGAVILAGGSDS